MMIETRMKDVNVQEHDDLMWWLVKMRRSDWINQPVLESFDSEKEAQDCADDLNQPTRKGGPPNPTEYFVEAFDPNDVPDSPAAAHQHRQTMIDSHMVEATLRGMLSDILKLMTEVEEMEEKTDPECLHEHDDDCHLQRAGCLAEMVLESFDRLPMYKTGDQGKFKKSSRQ